MIELKSIALKPDMNRPALKSSSAKRLEQKIIDHSPVLSSGLWERGEVPRVLLLVPPYTRITRFMDQIAVNIHENVIDTHWRQFYFDIIDTLENKKNIYALDEMKRAGIPMGLLRVGTAAKKAGYHVKIIDGVFEGWNQEKYAFEAQNGDTVFHYGLSWEELAQRIKTFNPHVVGITCSYTHQWGNARAAADLVKSIDEKIITLMGGVHVTGLPGDVLLDSPTDYVVVRQADHATVDLLNTITCRPMAKSLEEIEGIGFKKEGKAWTTFPRPYLKDISEIAVPDLSLANLSLYNLPYHSAGQRKRKEGNIMYGFTSIGCNTGCNFCAIPTSQGGFRRMPEEVFSHYLDAIGKADVQEFLVEDDHLFHDPAWARTVFKLLGERNISWYEEGGIGLFSLISLLPEVDEDFINQSTKNKTVFKNLLEAKRLGLTTQQLLLEMQQSGCYGGYLAVESANAESLNLANKPTLNASSGYTEKIVGLFRDNHMPVTCGLMLGFIEPRGSSAYVESREQILKTLEYGKRLKAAGAAFINPFIVTPLPGSPNFTYLEQRLGNVLTRNTDTGYSHEFATMGAPDGSWIRDEINLLRAYSLYYCNGWDSFELMYKTGTWPIANN